MRNHSGVFVAMKRPGSELEIFDESDCKACGLTETTSNRELTVSFGCDWDLTGTGLTHATRAMPILILTVRVLVDRTPAFTIGRPNSAFFVVGLHYRSLAPRRARPI